MLDIDFAGAVRDDQQAVDTRHPPTCVAYGIQRRFIGPMRVLDHQHVRLRTSTEQLQDGVEHALAVMLTERAQQRR